MKRFLERLFLVLSQANTNISRVPGGAMLQTILRMFPVSDNARVLLGITFICGASYLPIYMRGTATEFPESQPRTLTMCHACCPFLSRSEGGGI